jgi:hypothetical protein
VRIPTPPLDEDTASGRPRGFFTAATPPAIDSSDPFISQSLVRARRRSRHRKSLKGPRREWWEDVPHRLLRQNHIDPTNDFEFDVPEHLPSSPLCPANRRHTGKGTGLCVYHGRRRVRSFLRDEISRSNSLEKPEQESRNEET